MKVKNSYFRKMVSAVESRMGRKKRRTKVSTVDWSDSLLVADSPEPPSIGDSPEPPSIGDSPKSADAGSPESADVDSPESADADSSESADADPPESADVDPPVSEVTDTVPPNSANSESIISLSDTIATSTLEITDRTLSCSNTSEQDTVVSLSDTESDCSLQIIEDEKCIDLTEMDETMDVYDDDSVTLISYSKGVDHFRLDTAPDFIPVSATVPPNRRMRGRGLRKALRQTARREKIPKKSLRTISRSRKPEFPIQTLMQAVPQSSQPVQTVPQSHQLMHPIPSLLQAVPQSSQPMFPIQALLQAVHQNCENQFPNTSVPTLNENRTQHNKSSTRLIQLSYPNILNDNVKDTQKEGGLRPIIIDGANVGYKYGNGDFVMHGPLLVIQYFKNRGHDEIVCFLPQGYRHRTRSSSEERTVSNLEKESVFSFTPSRKLENGKKYTPYDDRFIIQYATERQGVIISNDGYRDLIDEEPSWRETIEKRIVNYTFARDIFMLPKDPQGPGGPTLDEVLKFP